MSRKADDTYGPSASQKLMEDRSATKDLKLTKRKADGSHVASLDSHAYLYMGISCTSRIKTLLRSHIFLIWKDTLESQKP